MAVFGVWPCPRPPVFLTAGIQHDIFGAQRKKHEAVSSFGDVRTGENRSTEESWVITGASWVEVTPIIKRNPGLLGGCDCGPHTHSTHTARLASRARHTNPDNNCLSV